MFLCTCSYLRFFLREDFYCILYFQVYCCNSFLCILSPLAHCHSRDVGSTKKLAAYTGIQLVYFPLTRKRATWVQSKRCLFYIQMVDLQMKDVLVFPQNTWTINLLMESYRSKTPLPLLSPLPLPLPPLPLLHFLVLLLSLQLVRSPL
jgi:hypothetical protein